MLQQNADGAARGPLAEWGLAFVRRLGTLLGFLGYLVITPVVAFYLLRDWRPLLIFVEELIPADPAPLPSSPSSSEYDTSLGQVLPRAAHRGHPGGRVCTGAGLAILGVPSALLLGVIAGVWRT